VSSAESATLASGGYWPFPKRRLRRSPNAVRIPAALVPMQSNAWWVTKQTSSGRTLSSSVAVRDVAPGIQAPYRVHRDDAVERVRRPGIRELQPRANHIFAFHRGSRILLVHASIAKLSRAPGSARYTLLFIDLINAGSG